MSDTIRVADVILDIPTQSLDSSYSYLIPEDCMDAAIGCAVLVEFGRRQAVGYIVQINEYEEHDIESCSFDVSRLKYLLAVVSSSYFDERGVELIEHIATSCIAPYSAVLHLLMPLNRSPKVVKSGDTWQLKMPARRRKKKGEEADLDAATPYKYAVASDLVLTDGQNEALTVIQDAYAQKNGQVVLLDGVTGSGKTEVYLRAIAQCLDDGLGAIVLVPEIALTPQTVSRFKSRFGDTVAVMHSGMKETERYDQWLSVRQGEKRVVVGARSALFVPMDDLGLIIIDEEHEGTYKQESAPRYHARDIAAWMAEQRGCTLILGTATPSIEALYNCNKNPMWHHVVLPERTNGRPLPPVTVVDMAKEFGSGSRSMFSKELTSALFNAIDHQEKVVMLLNQRGFANFVLCRECGYVPECPTCSVSLTYHEDTSELICHHCNRRMPMPARCPKCGSPYLKKFGTGTQRVQRELERVLEGRNVRVIRMDADTTSTRNAHAQLLHEFAQPGAAVLLGTQIIAKGLDFEDVTLVGVINADTMLKLPDFRSAERTFDLISQVAGRAGRGDKSGRVIVQTYMADSVAIQSAAAYDRTRFLKDELPKRKMLGYPPYQTLLNVLVWGTDESEVQKVAEDLGQSIMKLILEVVGDSWTSFGAAPCALRRLNGSYRWHILIKAPPGSAISEVIADLIKHRRSTKGVNVACDMNPYSLL